MASLGKNVVAMKDNPNWKKPLNTYGGDGGPPVDRDVEKYIDAKAEATRAMMATSNAVVEGHMSAISAKLDALKDLPNDVSELKLKANNEIPRLIGQAIGIILGVVALGMVFLSVFQFGIDFSSSVPPK